MSGSDADGSRPISEAVEGLGEVRDQDVPEAVEDVFDLVRDDMANVRRLVEAAQRHLDPQVSAGLDEAERRMVNGLRHLRDEVSGTVTSATDELETLRRGDAEATGSLVPPSETVSAQDAIYISSTEPNHASIRNAPPPSRVIVVDEAATYVTDEEGRVTRAEATLTLRVPGRRNAYAQRTLAGKLPGDDAGHLIARVLGGIGDKINLVPMLRDVNRKQMARLEQRWRHAVDQGQDVDLEIELEYADDTRRPVSLTVSYHVTGQIPRSVTLSNDAPEENEP